MASLEMSRESWAVVESAQKYPFGAVRGSTAAEAMVAKPAKEAIKVVLMEDILVVDEAVIAQKAFVLLF